MSDSIFVVIEKWSYGATVLGLAASEEAAIKVVKKNAKGEMHGPMKKAHWETPWDDRYSQRKILTWEDWQDHSIYIERHQVTS